MADGGEPAAKVVETARAHGYVVTDDQRVRWHRAGLLPRPVQRHLGRGHGTETVYPAGTAAQLAALLRLHNGKRLRVGHAGWALWWDGWPVDTAFARDFLGEMAIEWERSFGQLRDEGGACELSEVAWRVIYGRTDTPVLRRALKRVGSKRSPDFKRLLIAIAAGRFEDFMPEADKAGATDEDVFKRGMGVYRRSKFSPAHQGAIWLRGDLAGLLRGAQEALSPQAIRTALDEATDDDLMRARDECHALLTGLDNVRAVMEHQFGSGGYGLAALPHPEELHHDTGVVLLLAWLSFRQLPFYTGALAVLSAVAEPFAGYRQVLEASQTEESAVND